MNEFLKKNKNKIFKKIRRNKYYFPILKTIYTFMRYVLPMDKNLIVFESNVGKSIGDSPKAIYDEMQAMDLPYKYIWIYNGKDPIFTDNTKTVIRLGFKYYYYLARAGYWVNNQNFPTYLVKKKKTVFLQTWHGTPLKKMQNDIDVIIGRDATYLERVNGAVKQWDYLVSPSRYATECFITAFDYQQEILEVGYPRNDLFYQSEAELNLDKNQVRNTLNLDREFRKIILYAPTFRDDSLNKFNLELDLDRFTEELSNDYLLLVRGHMATGQKINIPKKFKGDILNVSSYPNIQELYLISDICITDYSSVMFDFAITQRPMFFFTYDLEHYKDNLRGFYIDFVNEAPGPLSKTTEELISDIKNVSFDIISDKYQAFYNKYCYLEDGSASERVIQKVFKLNAEEVANKLAVKKMEHAHVEYLTLISTDSTSFSINFTSYSQAIFLDYENQITIIQPKDGQYIIDKQVLEQTLTEHEGIIKLKNEQQATVLVKEFQTGAFLSMQLNNDTYYLYADNEKRLTINKNIIPDLSGYYLKHRVVNYEINNEKLNFEIELVTVLNHDILIKGVLKNKTHHLKKILDVSQHQIEVMSPGIFKHHLFIQMSMNDLMDFYESHPVIEREIFDIEIGFELFNASDKEWIIYDRLWLDPNLVVTQKLTSTRFYQFSEFISDKEGKILFKVCRVSETFYENQISNKSLNINSYFPKIEKELNEVELFFYKMSYWCLEVIEVEISEIKVEKNSFALKRQDFEEPIYLKNGSKLALIPKNADHYFRISKKLIDSIIGHSNAVSVIDAKQQPVIIDRVYQLSSDTELKLPGLNNNYYLYKSVGDSLRVSKNALPSYKSYYVNHSTENIYSEKGTVVVELTIRTLFYELEKVNGRVKLRGSNNFSEVLGEIKSSVKQENGYVISEVILKFSSEEVLAVGRNKDSQMYNYDIFDFLFNFSLKNQKLDSFNLNIQYGDIDKNTVCIANDEENEMFLFFYPTIIGKKLSAKMTLISEEVYDYYEANLNRKIIKDPTKKPIVLVTEYPHKAQDTGLAYFKYLVDEHSEQLDVYYLISQATKDFDNLQGYTDHVVYYKSKEHVDVFLAADILVSSHGTNYACPVVDDISKEILKNKFKVFLQHGILGVRDMTNLYGKNEEAPFTNLFVTSSQREYDMIVNEFGYLPNEVVLSGLSRFDKLFEGSLNQDKKLKKILIMPSWREGLDNKTPNEFKKSLFFKSFSNLITSPELEKFAKDHEIDIQFYLHTNFQKYTSCFTSSFVNIIAEGGQTVQELLIESDCLITDYSSVGLDFALMEKPIIYYQFDTDIKNSRDTLNYNFFPGEVKRTVSEVLDELTYLEQHPTMRASHITKLDDLYLYRDTNANQRIYEAMMKEYKNNLKII